MKFATFLVWQPDQAAALSQVVDKLATDPPPGYKLLAHHVYEAQPVSGLPPGTTVSSLLAETESSEAIAAASYPLMLTGAAVNSVAVLDIPLTETVAVEKKYRG